MIQKKMLEARGSIPRFQDLVENMGDWAWELDNDIVHTYVNSRVNDILGYKPEEVLGKTPFDFMTQNETQRCKILFESIFASEKPFTGLQNTMLHKDGHHVILESSGNPFFSNEGRLLGYRGIDRDITEQQQLRKDMKYYLERLTKAQEKERQRIARELHDDTAQILTRICNDCDLLLSSNGMNLDKLERKLTHIRDMTRLALEDIRRFCLELRPGLLDRFGLVSSLELLITKAMKCKTLKCHLESAIPMSQLPSEIELGLFRIAQEALNNCRRHSKATEAFVSISMIDKNIRLCIADNGIGFRVPNQLSTFLRSGKLGLIGISERVKLLNGTLRVNSVPGKGTTIQVEIPT